MAQEWDCVMLCMVMGKIVPRLGVRAERRKTSDGEYGNDPLVGIGLMALERGRAA